MTTQTSAEHIPVWTLGDRFRKAREDEGLTQQELADALGIDRNTVSAYETNQRVRPSKLYVRAWAQECHVPEEWLRTGRAPAGPDGPNRITGRYRRVGVTLPGLDLAAA